MFDSVKGVSMGMITRIKAAAKALFGPTKASSNPRDDYNKILKAWYDAAQNTKENRKSWANASDLPAAIKNNPEARRRLRARGELEYDNNSYMGGMVDTVATDTIGATAPKLQVISPDKGINETLQTGWETWSESPEVNLPSKLLMGEIARRNHGESFFVPFTDSDVEDSTGISLNIGLVSSRRVTDNMLAFSGYQKVERGILNDDGALIDLKKGRAKAYMVIDEGEELSGYAANAVTVSAKQMFHWFKPKKIGQYRGVCETAPALPLMAFLRRFTLATVSTAEIIASFTAFMKTQNPPPQGPAQVDDWSQFEITRGMLQSLPDGWEPFTLEPKHPGTNHEMFVNVILREVGRVMMVPFGIVSGDCSKYNYSSARLEFRGYDHGLDGDKQQLRIRVLNPTYRQYLIERTLRDSKIKAAMDSGKLFHMWRFAQRPSFDPEKDAKAEDIRLKNGTTNLAEIFADRGEDWVEMLEQRKKELDMIQKLGLGMGTTTDTETKELELDEDGKPIIVDGETAVVEGKTVQDTALNGAQIVSLLEITDRVANEQYPAGAAKGLIKTAFPGTDEKIVGSFVDEIAEFDGEPLTQSKVPAGTVEEDTDTETNDTQTEK